MVSRFLLLMALSVCVSGTLVVKVAHSSYQAEVDQDLTLEWTFTPRPDSSLQTLNIFCSMFNPQKDLVLLNLHKGVEVPQKEGDFVGRVQCDKEVLKEGQIRLHLSSLKTEDSGWYQCDVLTEYGKSLDRCSLNVTAKNQSRSECEAEGPNTVVLGRIDIVIVTLGTIAGAALIFFLYRCITRSRPVSSCRDKIWRNRRRSSNETEVVTKCELIVVNQQHQSCHVISVLESECECEEI
ncbi:uncharacterized protein LOC117807626 isoform X2 [Xyrichtys novacula]|uniref:Uncharacterized protein LOC117807626 isoform X2 n=1 Tax=Xyrichtys novacula TaxID=13765 RepID=A0AAV1HIC0_XYRNO|nr:uncharacterized protein LOC117807626 isoform X2 [Xyrichtys novacula]